MGFSANLQGRTAHEALLLRQDAELRLLETMKRCLMSKVSYVLQILTGDIGSFLQMFCVGSTGWRRKHTSLIFFRVRWNFFEVIESWGICGKILRLGKICSSISIRNAWKFKRNVFRYNMKACKYVFQDINNKLQHKVQLSLDISARIVFLV